MFNKRSFFKKNTILMSSLAIGLLLVSCSSSNVMLTDEYTYRIVSAGQEQVFEVAKKPVADIRIDLSKKVTGASGYHKSVKTAKEEAYYNAIVGSDIHLVVDPIYKTKIRPGLFGMRCSAEIIGYAGYYDNVRYEKVLSSDLQKEQEIFDIRIKQIETLSKNTTLKTEEQNTYLINTETGCCPESKSGTKTGQLHLLNTAKNSNSSIVDEYFQVIEDGQSLKNKPISFGLNLK